MSRNRNRNKIKNWINVFAQKIRQNYAQLAGKSLALAHLTTKPNFSALVTFSCRDELLDHESERISMSKFFSLETWIINIKCFESNQISKNKTDSIF
jgi:hypothetical protein